MFESVFVIVFSPPSEFHAILICAFRLASATPVIDYFESMHRAMTFLAFQFVSLGWSKARFAAAAPSKPG